MIATKNCPNCGGFMNPYINYIAGEAVVEWICMCECKNNNKGENMNKVNIIDGHIDKYVKKGKEII